MFVALWPNAEVRARLAAHRDAWRWPPDARLVADDQLHLTLHFIGAFARARIATLEASLAGVPTGATTLRAADGEVWRGGIAVLRLAGDASLAALHRDVGAVLAGLGVALDDRPFSPHVTFARRARGASPAPAPAAFAWRAAGFALVESLPGSGYRVLQCFGAATDRSTG